MHEVRRAARFLMESVGALVGPRIRRRVGNWQSVRHIVHWSRDSSPSEPNVGLVEVEPPSDVKDVQCVSAELMGDRPSYRYKLEELQRRQSVLSTLGVKDPVEAINDKYRAYEFADRFGIDHPRVFGVYTSISEVAWESLPDQFVLKSRYGSSNKGVKALVREGPDSFSDLLRSRSWTIDQIIEDQLSLEATRAASPTLFAEELILKRGEMKIADDWKFYTFDGVVGLCMQRDLRASPRLADWRFKFWDLEWVDMGPIKYVDRLDPALLPPRDPKALTEFAAKISALIRRPFMRIDIFESDRGPVLGEFTPRPGPPELFAKEIDEMLGRLWEEAEQRRSVEEIESGGWSHLLTDGLNP